MTSFGERLRELRSLHGLSQEAVAKKLGVSPQAVSKWEKGRSLPDLSVLPPLAELFRVSADELLGSAPPAEKWEAEWHRAVREEDPARAVGTALQALEQFPGDTRFLCRLAEAEFMAGVRAETEEDARRFLLASEKHHRAILRQFPDYEEASLRLARTLFLLGRKQEAQTIAGRLKNGDDILLEILEGEAREAQYCRMCARRAKDFFSMLMRRPSHLRMDLTEKLLTEFPWDPRDRLNLLSYVCCRRAALYCREGKPDEAMTALGRVGELSRQWDALPRAGEGAEEFLFGRVTGSGSENDWLMAFSLLHDPELKPVFDREEYKELIRLRDRVLGPLAPAKEE